MQYKSGGYAPEGVGLLISILLRYPEVGSIHYWQEKHALRFTFMVRNIETSDLENKLVPALEVFHTFEGGSMQICQVECRKEEQVCILTITRDVESMTQSEVGLIVDMVKMQFAQNLVCDESDLPEDELLFQEELIGHMLATIRTNDMDKNVVAVREEGRVIVFKN